MSTLTQAIEKSSLAILATKTANALNKYNLWRRGDETIKMPPPGEIGRTIDDAVFLLQNYGNTHHPLAENLLPETQTVSIKQNP